MASKYFFIDPKAGTSGTKIGIGSSLFIKLPAPLHGYMIQA
jgi:hypothetical protein